MPLTGKVVLVTAVSSGRTIPGRKLNVRNGRRGPIAPGPGGALLIKWERWRWTPCEPEVSELECGFGAEALLDRSTPLLDVLRRRVQFESCKTNCRRTKYCRPEIEMTGDDAWRGNEVVALLRLRKDKRNVVTLVTPGVHIHWCEEDAERRVQHDPVFMQVV